MTKKKASAKSRVEKKSTRQTAKKRTIPLRVLASQPAGMSHAHQETAVQASFRGEDDVGASKTKQLEAQLLTALTTNDDLARTVRSQRRVIEQLKEGMRGLLADSDLGRRQVATMSGGH